MKARIIERRQLCPEIYLYKIEAPHVAERFRPGQFVIIQTHEKGERIPLTVAEAQPEKGIISLVFQVVGKSTLHLSLLQKGQYLENCVGPLGNPSEIRRFGRVVCVGGGTGIACLWPILKALKAVGNEVLTIIGARTAERLILVEEIRQASSQVFITTDDGSQGEKGLVTDVLARWINSPAGASSPAIDRVIAIGPAPMMKKVAEVTRLQRIKTIVSLNTIMVDGTGMCGSCRVFLGQTMKLACIDGPEFDAHRVNFDDVISRLEMFRQKEKLALETYRRQLAAQREGLAPKELHPKRLSSD